MKVLKGQYLILLYKCQFFDYYSLSCTIKVFGHPDNPQSSNGFELTLLQDTTIFL